MSGLLILRYPQRIVRSAVNGAEGTYVALRLLINSKSVNSDKPNRERCSVQERAEETVFLPSVSCNSKLVPDYFPLPDYSPPFWLTDQCDEKEPSNSPCSYPGPATWLS